MAAQQTHELTARKPLRLWPGVVIAVLLLLVRLVFPLVLPGGAVIGLLGGLLCGLAIVLWWLFFSRAPWGDRVSAIVIMIVVVVAAYPVVHPSISNAMMGRMLPVFLTPFLALALVVAAALGRRLSSTSRLAVMVGAMFLAGGAMTLLRTDGVTGEGASQLRWRWTPTPEERLLAQAEDAQDRSGTPPPSTPPAVARPEPAKPPAPPAQVEATSPTSTPPAVNTSEKVPAPPTAAPPAMWSGFRGPNRDAVVRGVQIETDWAKSPPIEVWRRPIGPGWSSFAVAGDLIFTQEQRGEHELVSCYRLSTGQPVWSHRDAVRFYESNGGPGPRATPTVHDGRVFTLGATGIVNALHAGNGAVLWSRNAESDTGAPRPGWGFAGSPLVVDDLLVVSASGRLAAYDLATGALRWTRTTGGGGYSSPHIATIGGALQIVLLSGGGGASGVAAHDGTLLWQHEWEEGVAIVQPASAGNGDLLISGGDSMGGIGIRRIAITPGEGAWKVEERWTTRGLKPYFSDYVVHEGHAYGFDGTIMASIALADGQRKWKGGRYGAGQLVLLPEQDLLLVQSEEGELVLVQATPDKHTEIARFKAIEGKTWNHPVLVGDILLVRNGEEMAAFRLPRPGR